MLQPGDTILSLSLDHGGHLTHGLKVNFSGRLYTIVHYGVSRETNVVDYDEVLALAKEHRPKLIVCGGSAYPRTVETDRFREIADEVGALLHVRHGALRRARRRRAPPEPGAALRLRHLDDAQDARRAALRRSILCREEHAQAIDRAVFPGMQGGPLVHTIAAKATCFAIAATEPFRDYQRQVRTNADALAEELQAGGLDVLTGGTDTHLLQVDLRATEWTGKARRSACTRCKLTVNRNTVPFDERPPTVASGDPRRHARGDDARLRRGRLPRGRRGSSSTRSPDDADLAALARPSEALCEKRPLYPGFRGYTTYVA